jgi:DNA replication protein DnaD
MTIKNKNGRLQHLEQALQQQEEQSQNQVVIFDPETGLPLTPVPKSGLTIWIPDNKRGDGPDAQKPTEQN